MNFFNAGPTQNVNVNLNLGGVGGMNPGLGSFGMDSMNRLGSSGLDLSSLGGMSGFPGFNPASGISGANQAEQLLGQQSMMIQMQEMMMMMLLQLMINKGGQGAAGSAGGTGGVSPTGGSDGSSGGGGGGSVGSSSPSSSSGTSASSGPPGEQPKGDVKQWIDQAKQILQQQGVDISQISDADLNTIIQHESSGNPHAQNNTDSNAAAGHPSKGIMQTIDSTFNQYAVAGHKDIWNPVDNIVAGVRYAISRYGSISNVPGIKAVHSGRSYVGY